MSICLGSTAEVKDSPEVDVGSNFDYIAKLNTLNWHADSIAMYAPRFFSHNALSLYNNFALAAPICFLAPSTLKQSRHLLLIKVPSLVLIG